MNLEQWRKTRQYTDRLQDPFAGFAEGPGFIYEAGYIELRAPDADEQNFFYVQLARSECAFSTLKEAEDWLWYNFAQFELDEVAEYTITWTETITYSATTALAIGSDPQMMYERLQEKMTVQDIDKEEVHVSEPHSITVEKL